jgi:hypothetical protein
MFRWQQVRLFVLPIFAPALLERSGLGFLRKTRDQVGVAGGDAVLRKCLGHFGYKLQQRKPRVNVAGALAEFLRKRGHVVARHVEEPPQAGSFFVRMHIGTQYVFSQR